MAPSREDVLSYANGVTVAGLALSVGGAMNIDELSGVVAFGAGRALDVVDGYVARRFHASEFGAKLDATADKIAVMFGCYFAWVEEVAPEPVIATIVAVNIINAAANLYLESKDAHPTTDPDGRKQMAAFMATLGFCALGSATGLDAFDTAGAVTFVGGAYFAGKSSTRYVQHAWQEHQHSRTPKQNKKTPKHRGHGHRQ